MRSARSDMKFRVLWFGFRASGLGLLCVTGF